MSTCTLCNKVFTTKAGLKAHGKRKTPCVAIPAAIPVVNPAAIPAVNAEFRENSKNFNQSTTKELRQEQGIFFTPSKVRAHLFDVLRTIGVAPRIILEPSFGSGEFLLDAAVHYPDARLLGVEKNETLFQSVQCEKAQLTCRDFLEWTGTADLIIGNPPYFVIANDQLSTKEKKALAQKHSVSMTGRLNIYIMFLYKCVTEHLEADGFLAFILPTTLYNCSYYQPMRDYLAAHTTIHHLETLDKPGFFETGQDTTLIVLQKKKLHDNYLYRSLHGTVYLSPFYKELQEMTANCTTLTSLGLGAKTGNVVWNQVKENLSDDGTLLIYTMNIGGSTLTLNNLLGAKKQYVTNLSKPTLAGPVILVDRGYGNSLRFNAVLVELPSFYAENHINVIYPKTASAAANLARVLASFREERTATFLRWFIGNGAVSASDLENNLPIF